jgi:hypothetical protein
MRGVVAAVLLLTQLGTTTAPADRYFGRLKMSALRIRYETMQLKRRYESHELLPDQTLHLLLLTEDAFHEWSGLYPKDPWLASTGYDMAQVYEELPGTVASAQAIALLVYVKSHFPTTSYARESRAQLHRGVLVKPEPEWALAPSSAALAGSSATPAPAPGATPYRRARPRAARAKSVTSDTSSQSA